MTSDLIELLKSFNERTVKYLVVGGYAVIEYTEPRYTKDIDLWIATDRENSIAVFEALRAFGAPLAGITPDTFMDPDLFYQMGRAPLRVDVLMSIPGVEFDEAWERRNTADFGGISVPIISLEDLITNKLASGRPEDIRDASALAKSKIVHKRSPRQE